MGFTFEVVKPGIDEKAIRYSDPAELVIALGKAKAAALLAGPRAEDFRNKKAFLLTADQVVVCGSTILEKPESADEARQFIARYL
jgi:septum formation protein